MKENKNNQKSIMIAGGIVAVVIIAIILLLTLNKDEQRYKVTFDVNGGSSVEAVIINGNDTVTKPENPTKEGYEFVGWYLNDELYDFNTRVTSDINLEAKWNKVVEGQQQKPGEEKEQTVKVTKVSLNKTKLTLTEGQSEKLKATVEPTDATNKNVTWKSSDSKVATVDSNGNVKALKAGTVTITVTTKDGSYKATCKVTVTAKQQEEQKPDPKPEPDPDPVVSVTGVTLSKTTLSLTEGDSSKLTATVAPSNAANKEVTWESSNTSVATVDSNGNVKAIKAGTATITVTTKDGNHTATCTVTVKEKPANYVVTITPEAQDVGGVLRYKVSVTKNGSSFTGYQRIICGGVKLGSTVSLTQYEKIKNITSATITLSDGTDVTATVK